jgi:hypothetical protein
MRTLILPLELIELEEENYHLLASAVFADGSTRRWVIDTGASRSVFNSTLMEYYKVLKDDSDSESLSAGIGLDTLETKVAAISNLWFGDFRIKKLKVALIDLTHINNLYGKYGGGEICGLLGSDFLKKHKAVINYEKTELILKVK